MGTLDDEGPVRLAGGTAVTAHDWDAAAATALRRVGRLAKDAPVESAWDTLARTTVEGLVIPPLGTPDRLAGRGGPVFATAAIFDVGSAMARSESGWDIRSQLTDPDPVTAAAAAVADLENGATSLWLTVGGPGTAPADVAGALDGVFLEMAPIVVTAAGAVTDRQAADTLADLFLARGVTPDPGSNLGADPIGRGLRTGAPTSAGPAGLAEDVREIVTMATTLGIRALVVDGTAAHGAGAGDAQELGYTLAAGAA